MTSTPSMTANDVRDYLLRQPVSEEVLPYGDGRGNLRRLTLTFDFNGDDLPPLELYNQRLNADTPGVLYESVDVSRVYGRYSLAVIDPPVLVEGKEDAFAIRALNERGQAMLRQPLSHVEFACCQDLQHGDRAITGTVPCERRPVAEDERLLLNNISQVVRTLLRHFRCDDRFLGLYGAFAYDFVRLFEPLPDRLKPSPTQDFRLFMPDTLLFFDHLKERATLTIYDFLASSAPAADLVRERLSGLQPAAPPPAAERHRIPHKLESDTGRDAFMAAVDEAREQMRQGEFFEVVLSHSFMGEYTRSPLELYRRFRAHQPLAVPVLRRLRRRGAGRRLARDVRAGGGRRGAAAAHFRHHAARHRQPHGLPQHDAPSELGEGKVGARHAHRPGAQRRQPRVRAGGQRLRLPLRGEILARHAHGGAGGG